MRPLHSLKKVLHPTTPHKNNPYAHPSHPNHNPKSAPIPSLPSAAESSNLLAEARVAGGRDPLTGQRVGGHGGYGGNRDGGRADGDGRGRRDETEMGEETSAYNARSRRQILKTGTRYDLFVQDLKLRSKSNPPPPPTTTTSSSSSSSTNPATSSTSDPQPDTSAYISRLSATRKSMGTRYDLFVKEMRERRERERVERERRERMFSWYAPEGKEMVEYYAPAPVGR